MVTRQITNAYLGGGAFNSYTSSLPVSPQGVFTVSIAGRWYGIDTNYEAYRHDAFKHTSFPAQRQSVNLTNIAGEGTVNTDGLWRREQNDWTMGSGQLFMDRQGSMANRFYKSKGMDVWTRWQLNVLPATKVRTGYSGSIVKTIRANGYVYALTTTGVWFTSNYTTWSEVKVGGSSIGSASDIAANGTYVWVSKNTTLYQSVLGASTTTAINWHTAPAANITAMSWQRDALLIATGNVLGTIVPSSTSGQYDYSIIWTNPDTNFKWTSFATAQGAAYVAGYSIDSSKNYQGAVYFTTYDGTSWKTPVIALPMSNGEYVTALYGYLNFVFVGTNLGLRMTQPDGNNYLTSGPAIPSIQEPVKYPVTGITANGRFVYFAWNDYDDDSTGIGRADISNFTDTLTPAYASDLMLDWNGANSKIWLDWDPVTDGPLITVPDTGLYTKDPTLYVEQGWLDSGHVTYNIPDDKVVSFIHFSTSESVGDVYAAMSANNGNFTTVAVMPPPAQSAEFPVSPPIRGEYVNVKITLDGITKSSTLTRWTMLALPAISTETQITQVVQLADVVDVNGTIYTYDPYVEYMYLDNARRQQQTIQYIEGPLYADVVITDLSWVPYERRDVFLGGYRGNLVVTMKTINGFTYNPVPLT